MNDACPCGVPLDQGNNSCQDCGTAFCRGCSIEVSSKTYCQWCAVSLSRASVS
jgi:hypothetical protein